MHVRNILVDEQQAGDNLAPAAVPLHRQVAVIIKTVIERYHYKKQDLDDAWSASILDRYLESLDPNRSFFLSSDIASFKKYRYQFDDALSSGPLMPAYDIFNADAAVSGPCSTRTIRP